MLANNIKTKIIKKLILPICDNNFNNYLDFIGTKTNKFKPKIIINNQNLPYYEYILWRRNSKMKVVVHFKEDGLPIQKVIETLLFECCMNNS